MFASVNKKEIYAIISFVTNSTGIQTKEFRIEGMTCVNCQNRIEKKLKKTAGVQEAEANYNTGTATVTYDASVIDFNGIAAAVESLGYKAFEGGQALAGKAALRIVG